MQRIYLRWPVPTVEIDTVTQEYAPITGEEPAYGVDAIGRWYIEVSDGCFGAALRLMIGAQNSN